MGYKISNDDFKRMVFLANEDTIPEAGAMQEIANILGRYSITGEDYVDIGGVEVAEVVIRNDGKVLWVNTEKGCVLRICQVKKLVLDDRRTS